MMQCYPTAPPELLAVPVEHRLTAAVCLVSLAILLLSQAGKLRLRLGAYLERMRAPGMSTIKLFGTKL